jgi:4-diphosphocytidyl-2-C-methyl-D-erythritol kinase
VALLHRTIVSEDAEIRVLAPAKINLNLAVRGRRLDGNHELSTLMALLELADEVLVRRRSAPGISLIVEGPAATPDVPSDSSNLVWRAAMAVIGSDPGVGLDLRLTKRIPSRAGLGGGSSDAVATLLAVERLLGRSPDLERRRRTLAELGADCVFFHDVGESGIALCEGIGEIVTPLPGSPPDWVVLWITPRASCSTATIFAALDAMGDGPRSRSSPVSDLGGDPSSIPAAVVRGFRFGNDLEEAALRTVPELRLWRDLIDRSGGEHLCLSGSGSSFFGLYDSRGEAESDSERIAAAASAAGLAIRFRGLTRVGSGDGARSGL